MPSSTAEQTIAQITEKVKQMAVERAVAAGADPKTVVLAEVDAMPLQYVANQVRVIARAVGDFSPDASNSDVAITVSILRMMRFMLKKLQSSRKHLSKTPVRSWTSTHTSRK